MAEQASANALVASRAAATSASVEASRIGATPQGVAATAEEALGEPPAVPPTQVGDASLRSFSARADRVVARLRALERRPQPVRAPSAAAVRRRPGG